MQPAAVLHRNAPTRCAFEAAAKLQFTTANSSLWLIDARTCSRSGVCKTLKFFNVLRLLKYRADSSALYAPCP
jgi:hypothetical protein